MDWQVGFISLGCAKNLVDSQIMAGYLHQAHIPLAPSVDQADIIIVNTCAFIDSAREEAAEAILGACERKRLNQCRAVIVTGCLPQRYKSRARQAFPDVDTFLGTDQLEDIVPAVQALQNGHAYHNKIPANDPCKLYNPTYPTLLFSGGPFAYIKLGEGCSHRCAYCAIPQIRGAARFRPAKDILAEAKSLVQAGVRELNLIAQDVLSYHYQGLRILDLLKQICALPGDFRVRLLYGYPGSITPQLLQFIADDPKCCRYLDLPVQHASPKVLAAMNRADIADQVQTLPERIRAIIPDATLRTTCLLGFPGEREEDFNLLRQFIRTSRFDHLGCFAFSPEEGTPAFELPRRPGKAVAKRRCERLMSDQKSIVKELNSHRVGQSGRALLIRPMRGGKWVARLDHQAPEVDGHTVVSGLSQEARAGAFARVVITGFRGYNLFAEPC